MDDEIIDIFRGKAEITMFVIIGSLLILFTRIKKNIFCKDMKKNKILKKT